MMIRSLVLSIILGCTSLYSADQPNTTKLTPEQQKAEVVQSIQAHNKLFQDQKYIMRAAAPLMFIGWPEITKEGHMAKQLPAGSTLKKSSIGQLQKAREDGHKEIWDYITNVFGKKGLNCDADLLKYIKQFYFYFEFLTRAEKATKIIQQAQNQKKDWQTILKTQDWDGLLNQIGTFEFTKVDTDFTVWESLFVDKPGSPALLSLEQSSSGNFWDDLQKSSFWTIPVSAIEMRSSIFWQDYVKFLISNSIYCDADYVQSKEAAAVSILPQIQRLESSYYIPDFTFNRHQYETTQLSILLNEKIRTRLLQQCQAWKNIPVASSIKNEDDLITIAQDIRDTDVIKKFTEMSKPTVISTLSTHNKDNPVMTFKNSFERQETRFIGMASTLGFLIQDLFDDYKTAQQTLKKLVSIPKQQLEQSNFPSLLLYTANDAPYILDLADLHEHLYDDAQNNEQAQNVTQQLLQADAGTAAQSAAATTAQPTTQAQSNPDVHASSFLDSISSAFDTVKGWGEDIGNAAVAGWHDLTDKDGFFSSIGQSLYYGSGAAMAFQGASWDECKDKLGEMKGNLSKDVHDLSQQFGTIVARAAAFSFTAMFPYALSGTLVGGIFDDVTLTQDVFKMHEMVSDAIGSYFGHATELVAGGVITLSGSGLTFFTGIIFQTCMGNWQGLGDSFQILGQDIISGLLQGLVIAVDLLKSEWDLIGKAIGYLIKTLTDLIVDVVAGIWWIGSGSWATGTSFSELKTKVGEHRRVIAAGVGVGLFIGASIATGGSMGLIGGTFFAATFALPSITAGVQQDDALQEAKNELDNYFKNYAVLAANQTTVNTELNKAYEHEIQTQLDAEWINQKLAADFTENDQFDSLNSFQCSEAYALGSYQMQQLTKDTSTGIYNADPGNIFKYNTGWYNLNPSQGIVLYEPGRMYQIPSEKGTKTYSPVFAQEVAIAPAAVKDNAGKVIDTRFWFLQNSIKNFKRSGPSSPDGAIGVYNNSFEIRFRPLYTLDTFYIGIGIGGIPLDVMQLKENGIANLDQYYHTKMVTFRKDNTTGKNIHLGVYEQGSDLSATGWLSTTPWKENALAPGDWYRLKVDLPLDSTQLKLTAWKESEGKQKGITQTVNVTQLEDHDFAKNRAVCPAQEGNGPAFTDVPLMVIFSGASMEWMVMDPNNDQIFDQTTRRYDSKQTAEDASINQASTFKENIKEYKSYEIITTPLSKISLELASPLDALKGYYVYKTMATTALAGKIGAIDYVLLARLDDKSTKYGNSPLANNNGLVSLVTGKTYSTTISGLQSVGFLDVWSTYKQSSSLSSDLIKSIENAQQYYYQTPDQTNNFGLFSLTPASKTAKGQFIYTTNLKLNPDATQGTQEDYVVLVQLDNDKKIIKNSNLSFENPNANGLVSLTTNYIYEKTANPFMPPSATQPKACNNTTDALCFLTKMKYQALDASLLALIKAKQQQYARYAPAIQPEAPSTDSGNQPTPKPEKAVTGGGGTALIQQSGDEEIDLGVL